MVCLVICQNHYIIDFLQINKNKVPVNLISKYIFRKCSYIYIAFQDSYGKYLFYVPIKLVIITMQCQKPYCNKTVNGSGFPGKYLRWFSWLKCKPIVLTTVKFITRRMTHNHWFFHNIFLLTLCRLDQFIYRFLSMKQH